MSVRDDLKDIRDELGSIREILIKQDEKIKKYEKFYQATYKKSKEHKYENDRYKEKYGPLPSSEGSGSRDNSRG